VRYSFAAPAIALTIVWLVRGGGAAMIAVAVALGAGLCFTALGHRVRFEGRWGAVAAALEATSYAAALALAAASGSSLGVMLALGHACLSLGFIGSYFSPNTLLSCALVAVSAVALSAGPAALEIKLLLGASALGGMLQMRAAGRRLELQRRAERLEQALHATDTVLDAASQRALARTLHQFGEFLHELRNAQSGVRLNLEFLELAGLTGEEQGALRDALAASHVERRLLETTLGELRERAGSGTLPAMRVGDVLEHVVRARLSEISSSGELEIRFDDASAPFMVQGEPAFLALAVHGLLRAAKSCGARRLHLALDIEHSRRSILLRLTHDGRASSFGATRASSSEGELSFRLSRRYIELLDGSLAAEFSADTGGSFSIVLPGKTLTESNEDRRSEHDLASAMHDRAKSA
jgi:hypothetical protein